MSERFQSNITMSVLVGLVYKAVREYSLDNASEVEKLIYITSANGVGKTLGKLLAMVGSADKDNGSYANRWTFDNTQSGLIQISLEINDNIKPIFQLQVINYNYVITQSIAEAYS